MELLKRLDLYAKSKEEKCAFFNTYRKSGITYGELSDLSDRIANYLYKQFDDNNPIVVYGHKSPLMIAAFIGCVKAGHAYCPVDISIPNERLKDIIEVSGAKVLIKFENTDVFCENYLSIEDIKSLPVANNKEKLPGVSGEDTFYIIFTSGSTGKPKGVQITANCLDNYLDWMETIANREEYAEHPKFLNQAPFSFDLSVMDVYTSLYLGGTIISLDKVVQEDMSLMYKIFKDSGVTVWVSTPSFINMCLINSRFEQEMLPHIRAFLFCGEVLTNKTVRELQKRFPKAKIINTYGPTESTVAVTEVVITREMSNADMQLPIGYTKPGTKIFIMDKNYQYPGLPIGEKGEIVIAGNTVAKGYLNRPDLTEDKFFVIHTPDGNFPAYKTGDEGWISEGLLYYSGRIDFQLKINGYRIELGDIEENIIRIDNIIACVVLPIEKNGVNKGLVAFISLEKKVEDEFAYSQSIRKKLIDMIPHYMIPKKFIFLGDMPKTNNGKVDRQALKRLI